MRERPTTHTYVGGSEKKEFDALRKITMPTWTGVACFFTHDMFCIHRTMSTNSKVKMCRLAYHASEIVKNCALQDRKHCTIL